MFAFNCNAKEISEVHAFSHCISFMDGQAFVAFRSKPDLNSNWVAVIIHNIFKTQLFENSKANLILEAKQSMAAGFKGRQRQSSDNSTLFRSDVSLTPAPHRTSLEYFAELKMREAHDSGMSRKHWTEQWGVYNTSEKLPSENVTNGRRTSEGWTGSQQ